MNLNKRCDFTNLNLVVDFIQSQLQYSGMMGGYRWMYTKCHLAGLKVKKEDLRLILLELDEEGVRQRQAHCLTGRANLSKGPKHLWHHDSNDKLKPFGIFINSCIDGFSHKIIWLNAYHTSSDPKLIG